MNPGPMLAACLLLGGCGLSLDKAARNHRSTQAQARMAEYLQAQRSDDLLTMCVKSNLISAAYDDAGDAGNAQAWRSKNAEDCRAARDALLGPQETAD